MFEFKVLLLFPLITVFGFPSFFLFIVSSLFSSLVGCYLVFILNLQWIRNFYYILLHAQVLLAAFVLLPSNWYNLFNMLLLYFVCVIVVVMVSIGGVVRQSEIKLRSTLDHQQAAAS